MNDNNDNNDNRENISSSARIPEGFHAIVMYGLSKKEALEVMKAVKTIPELREAAFAMTTETNMEWPLEQLVFELSEEHRVMKGWKPRGNEVRSD